jgi:hypothetical protein
MLLAGCLLFAAACREPEQAPPSEPVATAVDSARRVAWQRGQGVRRLGAFGGRHRALNGSRRILADQAGAPVSISLGGLPAGRLYFAVTRVGPSATPGVECSASWAMENAPAEVIARLSPLTDAWVYGDASFPSQKKGFLKLECSGQDASSTFLWSQPLFVPEAAPAAAPLVVLMSLDTLRADHVSGFGAAPDGTPALGRVGRQGVRFTAASSQGTFTLSSHFALLYSRLYGFPPPGRELPVPLAYALAEEGFASIGVTGGGLVGSKFRFDSGFDHYAEHLANDGSSDIRELPEILGESTAWIDRLSSVPTFLFVHSYAVHDKPQAEVRSAATWKKQGRTPPRRVLDEARRFYGERVREMDRSLAPFFSKLEEVAQSRPVLLIVTSDHGEAFGEHDSFRHGYGEGVTLHQEVIHVPLIVWSPGFALAGRSVGLPAMLLDAGPSILDWLAIDVPESMLGSSLLPSWSGVPQTGDPVVSVSHSAGQWSARSGDRKLIVVMEGRRARQTELFDLSLDPGETRNLAPGDPKGAAFMRLGLASRLRELEVFDGEIAGPLPRCEYCGWRQSAEFWGQLGDPQVPRGSDELDAATLEHLRALGYVD